jgi:hypothetical protein
MAEGTSSKSSPLARVRLTVSMSLTRSIDQVDIILKRKLNVGKTCAGCRTECRYCCRRRCRRCRLWRKTRRLVRRPRVSRSLPTTLNHRLRHHCKSFRLLPKHRSFRLAPDPGARTKPKRRAADTARLLALVPNLSRLGLSSSACIRCRSLTFDTRFSLSAHARGPMRQSGIPAGTTQISATSRRETIESVDPAGRRPLNRRLDT